MEKQHLNIGLALAYAREHAGLTISGMRSSLLKDCGIGTNNSQIQAWESGKFEPSIKNILGVARVTQIQFRLNNNNSVTTIE